MAEIEFYLDLEDLPVDEDIPEDEDASNPERKEPGDKTRVLQVIRGRKATKQRLVVPAPKRLLRRGNAGRDVEAVQRALYKTGYVKAPRLAINIRGNVYNFKTAKAVKAFQADHKLEVDGVYGPLTHKVMVKAGGFDAYGAWLLGHFKPPKPKPEPADSLREVVAKSAMFGYFNRYAIHYTMGSMRMYGVRNKIYPPRIPIWEDCSSFATWCYFVAHKGNRSKDPNGLGFNGYGYTGTLARNGRVVSKPDVGDLGFYGPYPHKHVVIYVGSGKCVSHGSEGGPYFLTPYYRSDFNHWRSYL